MTTNKNLATIRTGAAVSWATGLGLLVSWLSSLSPEALLFIVSASTIIINRLGHELQSTNGRWTKLLGDILLWVDKTPVYESPPAPEQPND